MKNLEIQTAISNLRRFPSLIQEVLAELTDSQILFRQQPADWSIQEIVCHLGDEEEFDFPVRLKLTLAGANSWPPIDPQEWAIQRNYQEQDFQLALQRFLDLRSSSLRWLDDLQKKQNNWEMTFDASFGPISAGDLLFSWSAHDLLHLRQITKRLFEHNRKQAGRYSTRYAGDW